MATTQRPSPSDLNTELLVAESVPTQIRIVQQRLRELEASRAKYAAQLRRLIDLAIIEDVELCPAPAIPAAANGNAAGPGGADGAAVRGRADESADTDKLTLVGRARP